MMVGAAQLPKFEENIYHDAEEDYWFIGTAEIPFTNLHRDEILSPEALPLALRGLQHLLPPRKDVGRPRRAGHQAGPPVRQGRDVQADRARALRGGAGGHDPPTRRRCARRWRSPTAWWRCAPGTWASRRPKRYDLELWAPGAGEWLEVSSLSNCTDFQARRANIRYRPSPGPGPAFVHTLNGSGLALPRTLIAIMENYQQPDGSITIPKCYGPTWGASRPSAKRAAAADHGGCCSGSCFDKRAASLVYSHRSAGEGIRPPRHGGMAEWTMATVLKTVVAARSPGVRIPLPPPDRPYRSAAGLAGRLCRDNNRNSVRGGAGVDDRGRLLSG
jgi:hypothetical protein